MVSGLGLSPLKALETKPVSKPLDAPRASERSDFSAPVEREENKFSAKGSSEVQNKPLEKVSKKSEKNESSEFDKKLSRYSHAKESEDSKEAKETTKEEHKQKVDPKKLAAMSDANVSGYSQMQMLNIPTQNPKFEATEQPVIEVEGVKQAPQLTFQQMPVQVRPVAQFLQSMQEYFGIRPEKIMRALNQLSPEMLLKSPHEAMTPLFEKLGLQPRDFTKAQIFFNEMLTGLEQSKAQTALNPNMQALPMMPKGSAQLTSRKPTLDALIAQKISRQALEPQDYNKLNINPAVAPMGPQNAQAQQPQEPNLSQIFNVNPAQIQQSQMAGAVAVDKLQEFDPNLRIQDIKVTPDKMTDQFFADSQDTAAQLQLKNMIAKGGNAKENKDELKEDLKSKLAEQGQILGQQDAKVDNQFAATLNKMEASPIATAVRNENINNITDNAKTLIAKGGGEMKIQLRPEGMGDVLLKVKVQNGQVGIQMTTDSHDTKKLLEAGLNDLKLNLAEHKLSLHNINVDVSSDSLNNSLNNMNRDMQREQARDFLGQFREYNQAMRDQFAGPGSVKAYMKPSSPKANDVGPIQTAQSRRKDGNRLHLVA
jgi:flagellar hook-length control protein FliK